MKRAVQWVTCSVVARVLRHRVCPEVVNCLEGFTRAYKDVPSGCRNIRLFMNRVYVDSALSVRERSECPADRAENQGKTDTGSVFLAG